jgi:RNA polymerase sigma factor (sigma-70 family)
VTDIRPIAEVREELLPTRQSLLSRLKDWDDNDSWRTFFETYWKLIYRAAIRAGLTEVEAQDAVQETVISVSKSIKTFKYRPDGSFKGWLLRLTRWRINDQFKKRQQKTVSVSEANRAMPEWEDFSGATEDEAGGEVASCVTEASWEEGWEANLLDAALGRVKRRVDARQYQVFQQFVLKGRPANEVARALKIARPRIYLIKHRLNNLLKKEVARLRTKPL